MKELPKSEKLKLFIAPKITYLITFLDNNGNASIYKGRNIHYLLRYPEIIGYPNNLNSSSRRYHCFGNSKKNDTTSLQYIVEALCSFKKLFVDYMEQLNINIIRVSFKVLSFSHKVLGKI